MFIVYRHITFIPRISFKIDKIERKKSREKKREKERKSNETKQRKKKKVRDRSMNVFVTHSNTH